MKSAIKQWRDTKQKQGMCRDGAAFAKGKTITRAWKTCQHGGYVAWWLNERGVPLTDLRTFASLAGLPTNYLGCDNWTDRQLSFWADELRSRFSYTGRRLR